MIRTFIFALLVVFVRASTLVAAQTLSESFGSATLDSRLSITASSVAYSIGPLTPGATWRLAKQAGTTTGALEIHTNFKLSGNFTVDLLVDTSNLGTGELGMRLGEQFVLPYQEWFFQGPDGGEFTSYVGGGYGVGGFGVSSHIVTMRMVRSGSTLRYFANGQLVTLGSYSGTPYVTIFLRPYSGNGAFDPTVGQPDAHAAVLNQFTITADAFVPEPTSSLLMLTGLSLVCATWRRARPFRPECA